MSKHQPPYRAFTLLELMVTIAIVALTIGIAAPIYTDYINKSKVVSALAVLGNLENAAKLQFEQRSTATSLNYASYTLESNTVTALNSAPVVDALYVQPGGSGLVTANSFLVCVYVGDLSFDGYTAPTPGDAGSNSRICKLTTGVGTVYTSRCGALDGTSADIPTKYLPSTCNCANISGTC